MASELQRFAYSAKVLQLSQQCWLPLCWAPSSNVNSTLTECGQHNYDVESVRCTLEVGAVTAVFLGRFTQPMSAPLPPPLPPPFVAPEAELACVNVAACFCVCSWTTAMSGSRNVHRRLRMLSRQHML